MQELGCRITEQGAAFSIYVQHTFAMVLEVYATAEATTPIYKEMVTKNDENGIYKTEVQEMKEGMYYVWRMVRPDYSYSPAVMDPYTKGVYFINGEWRNLITDPLPYQVPKPKIPWHQTIIYELHVGHFTHSDPGCPLEERGTFKGLIRKLPYLKTLGITTLELLPVFKWYPYTLKTVSPVTGKLLEDVWGYNTLAFFAIDERFSVEKTCEGALAEFKQLIEAAHKEKIEVLLDVVYNHSGEGGRDGVSIHFKELAPKIYYKYYENGEYLNCSGTGNTLNTNHPLVKKMIKDSLLYWSQVIGVDGFRFDLASILGQDEKGRWLKESLLNEIGCHPILSKVKLITESWDAKGSYDVGRMPVPFCEWSDYFRDTIRKFVKGDQGIIPGVADCLMGKEIYFTDPHKGKEQTIHFITAHDGFTMRDLVSYNLKHNEANGENNRDGHNANYSYNWGIEGDTEQKEVLDKRDRAVRNLFSLLLLSKGIPMLLMGDEIGRTQKGNNNAFCQDNEMVWVDWEGTSRYSQRHDFVKGVIALRQTLDYYTSEKSYEISWHGVHHKQPDLSYYSRSIACYMMGKESLFLIANSYCEPLQFELPVITGTWQQVLNTASQNPLEERQLSEGQFQVQDYSICLLKQV